jgi:hypothetical protein
MRRLLQGSSDTRVTFLYALILQMGNASAIGSTEQVHRRCINAIGQDVSTVKADVHSIHEKQLCMNGQLWKLTDDIAEEVVRILDWICPPNVNPLNDHESFKDILLENTATWILENAKFKEWLSKPSSFLWLNGKSNFPVLHLLTSSGRGKDDVDMLYY